AADEGWIELLAAILKDQRLPIFLRHHNEVVGAGGDVERDLEMSRPTLELGEPLAQLAVTTKQRQRVVVAHRFEDPAVPPETDFLCPDKRSLTRSYRLAVGGVHEGHVVSQQKDRAGRV